MVTIREGQLPTHIVGANAQVLMVVGVWRSGTSLLYALLNQHPGIHLMYEAELPLLWPHLRGERRDWRERWEQWNRAPSRHGLPMDVFPSPPRGLRETCIEVYLKAAEGREPHYVGEKFPSFHNKLTRLAELFPDARFILIWRNPLGICSSMARAARTSRWNARTGMLHRGLFGCEQMLLGARQLASRGLPVHELSYLRLTGNTERELRAICDFLAVPFVPEMLELRRADRSAVYAEPHHAGVWSDRVLQGEPRDKALSERAQRKIKRYLARWQRIYGLDWLALEGGPWDGPEPSWLERVADRAFYRSLCAYDGFVRTVFGRVPLRVWRAYRGLRRA
jgi:hypothetical protein